jgi:transposase-like protein
MTEKTVEALELLFKTIEQSQGEMLKRALLTMLNDVMDTEASALCGAEYRARDDERVNRRNGYRERTLQTRMGELELAIPKLRSGSYMPSFLEPRKRWERAFVNVVCEAYVHGVSTRKVEDLAEAMGAKGMSKSTVSRMAAELDVTVREFRERPIEPACPYVWLDATYIKVREGGRIVSKAVLLAYGVTEHGEREVLGVDVADGEMEDAWRRFLGGLLERGLRGVQLVISDAHSGLTKALKVFNGASWQRCRVHFMRNVLCRVPKAAQGFVSATVRHIFNQPTYDDALAKLEEAVTLLENKYPAAAQVLREGGIDAITYMSFPDKHRRQIHSTNPLERLNREIKRRVDVVGIFPNNASALRLVTMLVAEQHDEWAVGRRYFSLESMAIINPKPEPIAELEDAS